jgi:hypothetical protein
VCRSLFLIAFGEREFEREDEVMYLIHVGAGDALGLTDYLPDVGSEEGE